MRSLKTWVTLRSLRSNVTLAALCGNERPVGAFRRQLTYVVLECKPSLSPICYDIISKVLRPNIPGQPEIAYDSSIPLVSLWPLWSFRSYRSLRPDITLQPLQTLRALGSCRSSRTHYTLRPL